MKTKVLAVTLLFVASAVLATAGGEDAKKDMEKLKGTWKLIGETDSGQPVPPDPNEIFIFDGKEDLVNKVGAKITDEFTIKLNPTKNPKEMDFVPKREPNVGVPSPAIYKFEDKKLIICVNFAPSAKRPTTFESTAANHNILLTLEMDTGKKSDK
jgi:uncharacterized protein (TIGR03067 family)